MFLGKFPDVRIKLISQGFHYLPCCPEVVKIHELSFVFKSLEKKNFDACRSSDRCLLECSFNYWLHHVVATIAQAPARWQVFDAAMSKLNTEIWFPIPHSSKHRGTADA